MIIVVVLLVILFIVLVVEAFNFDRVWKKCFYCETYDSRFDKKGRWLELKCKGESCDYCKDRPEIHPKDCKNDYKARSLFRWKEVALNRE